MRSMLRTVYFNWSPPLIFQAQNPFISSGTKRNFVGSYHGILYLKNLGGNRLKKTNLYQCTQCEKKFNRWRSLERHANKTHEGVDKVRLIIVMSCKRIYVNCPVNEIFGDSVEFFSTISADETHPLYAYWTFSTVGTLKQNHERML